MPRMSLTHRCGLAALVLLGACSGKKPEATPPAAAAAAAAATQQPGAPGVAVISDAERMVLDTANNLFRAKDYKGALAGYRRAAAIAPTDIAPWFGVYMVGAVTKDIALGEEAKREMTARGGAPGEADSMAVKAHQVVKPKPTSTIH
jgi:hypothetical protein